MRVQWPVNKIFKIILVLVIGLNITILLTSLSHSQTLVAQPGLPAISLGAIQLYIKSNEPWRVEGIAKGEFISSSGSSFDIERLEFTESGDEWRGFSLNTPVLIAESEEPTFPEGIILSVDYRFLASWEEEPGSYRAQIEYQISEGGLLLVSSALPNNYAPKTGSYLRFQYSKPTAINEMVTIEIVDEGGVVRHTITYWEDKAGWVEKTWDGCDHLQRYLKEGEYTYRIYGSNDELYALGKFTLTHLLEKTNVLINTEQTGPLFIKAEISQETAGIGELLVLEVSLWSDSIINQIEGEIILPRGLLLITGASEFSFSNLIPGEMLDHNVILGVSPQYEGGTLSIRVGGTNMGEKMQFAEDISVEIKADSWTRPEYMSLDKLDFEEASNGLTLDNPSYYWRLRPSLVWQLSQRQMNTGIQLGLKSPPWTVDSSYQFSGAIETILSKWSLALKRSITSPTSGIKSNLHLSLEQNEGSLKSGLSLTLMGKTFHSKLQISDVKEVKEGTLSLTLLPKAGSLGMQIGRSYSGQIINETVEFFQSFNLANSSLKAGLKWSHSNNKPGKVGLSLVQQMLAVWGTLSNQIYIDQDGETKGQIQWGATNIDLNVHMNLHASVFEGSGLQWLWKSSHSGSNLIIAIEKNENKERHLFSMTSGVIGLIKLGFHYDFTTQPHLRYETRFEIDVHDLASLYWQEIRKDDERGHNTSQRVDLLLSRNIKGLTTKGGLFYGTRAHQIIEANEIKLVTFNSKFQGGWMDLSNQKLGLGGGIAVWEPDGLIEYHIYYKYRLWDLLVTQIGWQKKPGALGVLAPDMLDDGVYLRFYL